VAVGTRATAVATWASVVAAIWNADGPQPVAMIAMVASAANVARRTTSRWLRDGRSGKRE
ncbi:MAG: hypothetical protein QGI33_01305, partial [Candidatus Brocadiia bacterium]|nr:hypothetical protein [Candidatus Brocadiia bacterium]